MATLKYPGSQEPMKIEPYNGPLDAAVNAANEAETLHAENARLQEHVKRLEITVTLLDTELSEASVRLAKSAEIGLNCRRERDGYKALAERRKEALEEDAKSQHKHGPTCDWGRRPKPQLCVKCGLEAIAATAEALEEKP